MDSHNITQVNETDCEEGDSPFVLLGEARMIRIKPFRTLEQLRTLFVEPLRRHKVRSCLSGRNLGKARLEFDQPSLRPPVNNLQLIHFKGNMSQLMAMTPAEVQKHSQDIQKYMMGVCCVHEAPHKIR